VINLNVNLKIFNLISRQGAKEQRRKGRITINIVGLAEKPKTIY
jgi:hypothetical protein